LTATELPRKQNQKLQQPEVVI